MNDIFPGTDLTFKQRTLSNSFHCIGKGYHTGISVGMTVQPADANTGYVFQRRDVYSSNNEILARWYMAHDSNLNLTLVNSMGVQLKSVEHLLAALYGCGIDNAYISLDGPEIPALDGSCAPFVELIRQVGSVEQSSPRKAIVLTEAVRAVDGESWAKILPSTVPSMDVEIELKSKAIGFQSYKGTFTQKNFENELAPARIYGFAEQLALLKDIGMGLGGSVDNSVLVSGNRLLNPEGFRFPNECARHKALDATACLSLSGARVIGHYFSGNAGHRLNTALMHALMSQTHSYRMMDLCDAVDFVARPVVKRKKVELRLV